MATVVAGTSLMASGSMSSTILRVAVRFATWILPPQRKDWAEAMFNEVAYVRSRRAALRWVLGSTLFAIKARASYELVSALTLRRPHKVLLGLSVAAVIAVIGVYAIQKPYQRERILLVVLHGCRKSSCAPH